MCPNTYQVEGDITPMTQHQKNRQAENKKYMDKQRARGWQVATFLCPSAIREDVRQFIKTRSQELLMKG